MDQVIYNELFDLLEKLNNEEGYEITLGIRDSNWVTPKDSKMPGYKCEVILSEPDGIIFESDYTSKEAQEVEHSLSILLTEARDALTQYIRKE